jgi:methionyl-tRNA synthetase
VPLPEAEGKVLYVWFDAPIGYISATKEWAKLKNNPGLWETYWKDQDTELIHFIGKDNIVFHCIMFPAMLKEHGEFVLPKNVPANEFLNLEGRKLSTSRGWAVWLHEYLEDFEPDLLRYVLGSTLPEAKDSDFSWKDFQTRVNSELADILGNFLFRTLSFCGRYFDSQVPPLTDPSDLDKSTLAAIATHRDAIADYYERFRFRDALSETMNLARLGNRYLTETEPWHTRKSDPRACANTIHVCLQLTAALSVLFDPILPNRMKELRGYLNMPDTISWNVNGEMLNEGHTIETGEILFKKIEDEAIEAQLEKLHQRVTSQTEEKPKLPAIKETINYDTFSKLDMRAAEILAAEEIPKSNKLLKLSVDLGIEKLKPRKMMGYESQGMVLMAEDSEEKLHFLSTDAENGSPIS